MTVTICKLGGSLLDLPDLGFRLGLFLTILKQRRVLFVVGGGQAADLVREWDRLHQLSAEGAHWLALRAMMPNAALVNVLVRGSRLVRSRDAAEKAWDDDHVAILCAHEFVRAEEHVAGNELPHSWDATSDSIAAWVACRWPAERLILLKSVSQSQTPSEQLVDLHFRNLAPKVSRIDWVNLRAEEIAIEPYQAQF